MYNFYKNLYLKLNYTEPRKCLSGISIFHQLTPDGSFFSFLFFFFQNYQTVPLSRCSYQYCLAIVNFDNVEAETVDSFSGGHENTPRWIKMTANIYQDLRRR